MLKFVALLDWMVGALGALFIIFQIVIPAFRGTPYFPWFRGKRREAVSSLVSANEDAEIQAIQEQARRATSGRAASSTTTTATTTHKNQN